MFGRQMRKGLQIYLFDTLSKANFSQKISIMMSGAKGILGKDIDKIVHLLVDIEFLIFKDLNIGAIFLHDSLTDLALGSGC